MTELAKINHSNIMGYYGYEKNDKGLFIFVEFCSGGSFKQLIGKKVSELKAITLLTQLFDAMAYINKLSTCPPIQTNFTGTSSQTIFCLMKTKNLKLQISDWLEIWRYR